ncbi:MAG: precorrin-4 C(11)-methyltransferase, partial [Actinobacteria bacterium]
MPGRQAVTGKVTFVGAGPGAADLITVRGVEAIRTADVVVWAASLVHPDVLSYAAGTAEIVDSAELTLESTVDIYRRA